MAENIYSTQKIIYHPDKLSQLQQGAQTNPIQMQLMPINLCNQNCSFCHYRSENNPKTMFDWKSYIPWEILERALIDFKYMGGKCVELTGGGEPLMYPHIPEVYEQINKLNLEHSLITNGTLATEQTAELIAPTASWIRVSLDAGTPATYAKMRKTKADNFHNAIKSVELFRKYAKNPEFKLGVGYVVCNDNYNEIYEACKIARESGADNFKISAVFHSKGTSYFNEETLVKGKEIAASCMSLATESFSIYNIFDERIENVVTGTQNYKYCSTKDLMFVLGGDCNVYTCCTLSYTPQGLIGNIKDMTFKELWNSKAKKDMFRAHDPRKSCRCSCMYEQRNKFINNVLYNKPKHVNFI